MIERLIGARLTSVLNALCVLGLAAVAVCLYQSRSYFSRPLTNERARRAAEGKVPGATIAENLSGPDRRRVTAGLLECLGDPSVDARRGCARALEGLAKAPDADLARGLPVLEAATYDPDRDASHAACRVVMVLAPAHPDCSGNSGKAPPSGSFVLEKLTPK